MEINKKGQFESIGILAFVFILIIIAGVFFSIFTELGNLDTFTKYNVSNEVIQAGKDLYSGMDFAIPGVLLALNIGTLIMLYFLKSSPILSVVVFIMIPITILISAVVSNSYQSTELALNLASTFPLAHFIMGKLPLIEFVFDILGGILLFAIDR